MKKMLVLSTLFFSLDVCGQTEDPEETDTTSTAADSVEVRITQLPDSTAIGVTEGQLVSKAIGASGGKITSDDGRVELLVPAGALAKTTTISIQPIKNLVPNGNGKGYQFEPSGTRFVRPVEIIFHYSQKENETCPASLHFMAIQDKNGKWEYINYEDWDSMAKSLKGHITHFSAMVDGSEVELQPREVDLGLGQKCPFYLQTVVPPPLPDQGVDELPFLPGGPNVKSAMKDAIWSAKSGKVTKTWNPKVKATYTAPTSMPAGRKDEVNLTLNMMTLQDVVSSRRVGKVKPKDVSIQKLVPTGEYASFSSSINLYSSYRVVVTHTEEYRKEMGLVVTDKSSFDVAVMPPKEETKKPPLLSIYNIKRYTPQVVKQGHARAGCKLKVVPVPGTNSIYISSIYENLEMNGSDPQEVSFNFPEAPSEQVFFKFQCAGKTPLAPLSEMPLSPSIKFIANDQRQTVTMRGYSIEVTPIR